MLQPKLLLAPEPKTETMMTFTTLSLFIFNQAKVRVVIGKASQAFYIETTHCSKTSKNSIFFRKREKGLEILQTLKKVGRLQENTKAKNSNGEKGPKWLV